MTTNPDVLAAASQRRWMAYHVFYGGNPEVLLEECLLPLAAQLEEEGLVRLSFYINYWLEGGHVRLRLLPALGRRGVVSVHPLIHQPHQCIHAAHAHSRVATAQLLKRHNIAGAAIQHREITR